jgi:hypothetical protein
MKRDGITGLSLLSAALILCLLLFCSSCAFLSGVLDDLMGGRGAQYTLTIYYTYYGSYFTPGYSQIVFWVMPLDADGEVMEDPGDPGGPPVRKEINVYERSGRVSSELQSRDYALLAFCDENMDGLLNLFESYTIYEGESLASAVMDRIELDRSLQVNVSFGDEYEWHAVVIRYPSEGQTINGYFTAEGGFFTDDIKKIDVHVDGSKQGEASLYPDHSYWKYPVNVYTLDAGASHSLEAIAFDQYSNEIDRYITMFFLQSK